MPERARTIVALLIGFSAGQLLGGLYFSGTSAFVIGAFCTLGALLAVVLTAGKR